jgi:hypothetical protein
MVNKFEYPVGAVTIIALLLLFFAFFKPSGASPAFQSSQDKRTPDLPVVDYDSETKKLKTKARKEKDDHFKGRGNPDRSRPIAELPDGVEPLPTSVHWWIGLSAIPVDKSDVVVLGYVSGRETHLSDDRTGIYSEFTVQVAEIFKDTTSTVLSGTPLTVNRLGGSVRFGSGKLQEYRIHGQDMPQVGSQYVLFLRKTAEGDLLILTGYELANEHVSPLDGEESPDPRSDLPFAKYRGAAQAGFLKEIRDAATRSTTGGAN